ncbi:MAG: hypothetical protein H8E63_03530, partial [Proteobacteria bacterium]|nr:hypothetical protein [Pseudomonadota bacterium]
MSRHPVEHSNSGSQRFETFHSIDGGLAPRALGIDNLQQLIEQRVAPPLLPVFDLNFLGSATPL